MDWLYNIIAEYHWFRQFSWFRKWSGGKWCYNSYTRYGEIICVWERVDLGKIGKGNKHTIKKEFWN